MLELVVMRKCNCRELIMEAWYPGGRASGRAGLSAGRKGVWMIGTVYILVLLG